MNHNSEIIMSLDKLADVMYIIRKGVDTDKLSNIDSERIPGIVKRIDPETHECVGFIIYGYSEKFRAYRNAPAEQMRDLWDMSLNLTNETNAITA